MTGNEYQKLAMRTCNFKKDVETEAMLSHGMLGLCSEVGELAGIYQKSYQGHPCRLDHIVKELGDCLWMIAEICEVYGVKMDDVMSTNIEKLKKRYPNGFESEKSLNRAEGDI